MKKPSTLLNLQKKDPQMDSKQCLKDGKIDLYIALIGDHFSLAYFARAQACRLDIFMKTHENSRRKKLKLKTQTLKPKTQEVPHKNTKYSQIFIVSMYKFS